MDIAIVLLSISTGFCTVISLLSTRNVLKVERDLRKRVRQIDEAVLEVEAQRSRINKLAGRVYWDERHPRGADTVSKRDTDGVNEQPLDEREALVAAQPDGWFVPGKPPL